MKTITRQEVVPAETVTITTYGCDVCEFTSDEEDVIEHHYGESHAVKADCGEFSWLDTEKDAELWLKSKVWHGDLSEFNWDGPGWYTIETKYQRCSRNCCDDRVVVMRSVGDEISTLKDKIARLNTNLLSLLDLAERKPA